MLETPSIALQSTVSEMVRMGHVVRGTMNRTRDVLITKKREEIEKDPGRKRQSQTDCAKESQSMLLN